MNKTSLDLFQGIASSSESTASNQWESKNGGAQNT